MILCEIQLYFIKFHFQKLLFNKIYQPLIGTKCRLYTAVVSNLWDPTTVTTYDENLVDFKCFSSWQKRNDIIGKAENSGSVHKTAYPFRKVKDGFYCQNGKFLYHTHTPGLAGDTWFQVDLKQQYSLKCVRVSVRDLSKYLDSYFEDVEFRFGNKSHAEDSTLNPMIGFVAGMAELFVEICPKHPIFGRYLSLRLDGRKNLCFGEMQIIVN